MTEYRQSVSRTIHVKLSLQGAVNNFRAKDWKRVVQDDDGRYMTPDEVKRYFVQCLADGKLYLPYGECEGFDYRTGCPGHPKEASVEA